MTDEAMIFYGQLILIVIFDSHWFLLDGERAITKLFSREQAKPSQKKTEECWLSVDALIQKW